MKQKLFAVLRVLVCILLLAAAYVLQTGLGSLSRSGVHLDLLPLITASAGLVMGSGAGMLCGLFTGILYDVSSSGIEGIYPLYYMLWGIACGYLKDRRYQGLWAFLCAIGMRVGVFLLRYLFYFQFETDAGLWFFARGIGLYILLTLLCSPLVFLPINRLCGDKKTRHSVLTEGQDVS